MQMEPQLLPSKNNFLFINVNEKAGFASTANFVINTGHYTSGVSLSLSFRLELKFDKDKSKKWKIFTYYKQYTTIE